MKRIVKVIWIGILLAMLPSLVSAKKLVAVNDIAFSLLSSIDNASVTDSIPRLPRQDDQDKKSKKRGESKGDEKEPKPDPRTVEIDPKKPDIKQVPKFRPKLRPGGVGEGIKIKRPPIKGGKPGRGLAGHLGI
jgi:hypothetical protein